MSKTHIFHHTDTDGHLAGFLARRLNNSHENNVSYIFHAINYGWKFPLDEIDADDKVVIVDFTLDVSDMTALMGKISQHKNIVWIDHHKSAIEKYEKDLPAALEVVPGVRYIGLCGAMLTWIYFSSNRSDEDYVIRDDEFIQEKAKVAPAVVKLVNDHDVWDYRYGETTVYFQTYVRSQDSTPESGFWDDYDYSDSNSDMTKPISDSMLLLCTSHGKIMTEYKRAWEADYVKKMSFEADFHGYNCLVVNTALANMSFFDSVKDPKYDIYITFSFNGESYNYSLYSETVDVAKLAEKYGGGGHRGAAGFRTPKLIWPERICRKKK